MTHAKLSNTENSQDDHITTLFKDKILKAIIEIRTNSKKRPDLNSIYNYVIKSEASNVDIDFIESVMVELINDNKITNKKTVTGLDSFYILPNYDLSEIPTDAELNKSSSVINDDNKNDSSQSCAMEYIDTIFNEMNYDDFKDRLFQDL